MNVSIRIQVMGVWNSSKQTVQDIIPVFLLLSLWTETAKEESATLRSEIKIIKIIDYFGAAVSSSVFGGRFKYILTSHDFSWLQKGHVN